MSEPEQLKKPQAVSADEPSPGYGAALLEAVRRQPKAATGFGNPAARSEAGPVRTARTATVNDWSAVVYADGQLYRAPDRPNLEIFDRVGGGDSFASGLIYGLLAGRGPQWAVECGAAHGALAMTTPGDTTMVSLAEVERVMKGGTARVSR